ncbi:MAG: hypothetical protein HZB16_23150 [Armatimonadetes bacterium]|nr:hypothetical protein [Armatimonadota bacterium]
MKRLVIVAGLLAVTAALAEPPNTYVGKLVAAEGGKLTLRAKVDFQDKLVELTTTDATSVQWDGQPATLAGLKRGAWLRVTFDGGRAVFIKRGLCPLAEARAEQQKLHPWPLSLTISVSGPKDGQSAELTLGTALDGAPAPAHLAAVAPDKAGAMLDYLAAEGFLELADKPIAPLAAPHCLLTLRTDRPLDLLADDEPWTAETRARLDGLRSILPDAKELDRLLAQTKDWPLVTLVEHDEHDGYFVKNTFEPDAPTSFLALRDQAAYNNVFGAGFVMDDRQHRLPKNAFADSVVFAAIHRGHDFYEYRVRHVTVLDGVLRIEYLANTHQNVDATFACPLIVRVPRGAYRAVEFAENGKVVKRLAW